MTVRDMSGRRMPSTLVVEIRVPYETGRGAEFDNMADEIQDMVFSKYSELDARVRRGERT